MYGPPVTRLPLFLLRFLILMAVVWPDLASAATSTNVETRVMGIALVAPTLVGGSSARSPEKHLGSSLAYDEIAPGYSLAAEGVEGATSAAMTAEKSFFEGTQYTQKVLTQMRGGAGEFHSFPESVTAFESAGSVRTITGGDGVVRQLLEIPGSYGGRDGVFQFIQEVDGSINHRLFVPTGTGGP